ncbi:DUF2530 domain-containing protein [Streptomyces sp. RKAG293]|uniref:DUF2530 domain-containing protein n=1 Tax=Streptomyces sp. RKAG293 TaxID=2893403 RepID=UPI0020336CEF|nr:DUF2530 domain-containing protein [Streptomyces sp. RKAG293]MCM2420000.1 DUF2530 domain-containing protein [Streptomyces sp. RKAG293]
MSKWKATHETPEPLEANDIATVLVGTVVWFVLFIGQLPFYGWYADHGHAWWIWTCLAGTLLGLFGLWYVRGRNAALQREAAQREAPQDDRNVTP